MTRHSPYPLATARLVLVCSLALLLGAGWMRREGVLDLPSGVYATALALSGVTTFLAFIHSFSPFYAPWMRFAEVLQHAVITALHGVCYLIVVPFFFVLSWPFDPLRIRKRASAKTFWVQRSHSSDDLRSLQRLV